MANYQPDLRVDSFEPDTAGRFRIRRSEVQETIAVGDVVSISDDKLMGFARIVSIDADGWIVLDVLAVTPADQADDLTKLLADEWSDLLDEE